MNEGSEKGEGVVKLVRNTKVVHFSEGTEGEKELGS